MPWSRIIGSINILDLLELSLSVGSASPEPQGLSQEGGIHDTGKHFYQQGKWCQAARTVGITISCEHTGSSEPLPSQYTRSAFSQIKAYLSWTLSPYGILGCSFASHHSG